jgi:nicotinamide mononucleotide transporter
LSVLAEFAGVGLGLAYLLLAIRQQRAAWIAGAAASLIFVFLFREAGLTMQALLQLFYIAVAVHGFYHWGAAGDPEAPRPHRAPLTHHALWIVACVLLAAFTTLLQTGSSDIRTWLDGLSSWGGVLATLLVARKVLESWLYWIVIDLLTTALYLLASLYATAALYAVYTILAYIGYREWRKHHTNPSSPGSATSANG